MNKEESYRLAAFIEKQSDKQIIEIIQYSGFKKYCTNDFLEFKNLSINIHQIKGIFNGDFEELFLLTKNSVFIQISIDEPVFITKLNPILLLYFRFILTISTIRYEVEEWWQRYKLDRKK